MPVASAGRVHGGMDLLFHAEHPADRSVILGPLKNFGYPQSFNLVRLVTRTGVFSNTKVCFPAEH